MALETVKENLRVNKLVATKSEVILVEGDMIVPDSKPDILNTICTSGVVCIYKKEVLEGKVRIDGNIDTYIMYMSEDEQSKVRGLSTSLDFSESLQIANVEEGMDTRVTTKLKNIESKVINGRKIGIKAAIEVEIKVYSVEDIDIVNDIANSEGIQMLKESLRVNSLVGTGENKIFAKDTININNTDNLAEILKANINIGNRDVKISYNKILTKADAEVKIMYLTEDNRIGTITTNIPVIGFIDIQDVTEENICDVDYEIRNIVLKPNSAEEHSIYIEVEIGVVAVVYEEKQIELIQDLYSPTENLEFNQRNILAITEKNVSKNIKQIREKIVLENLGDKNIVDVDIMPIIEKEHRNGSRIVYEAELELKFILANSNLDVDTSLVKIPFDYSIEGLEDDENTHVILTMEVVNQDFIVQDGGVVNCNVDLEMNQDSYRNANINVIDEIEASGEREEEDYSILMYIVKKDDSLWKIAKKFGSTVEDIARTNGIEDENNINVGQKLFIPHYTKIPEMNNV